MNVIISNKLQPIIQGLEIETLKTLNGVFGVDEIIDQFKVIFFQRMILDITAIKDYKNIENLQKLAISLDTDKIILVLEDDAESSSPSFQSKLISMGIYNFTNNLDGINYLYNHPNTYRDVAHIQQLDMVGGSVQSRPVVQTEQHTETVYVEHNGPRVIGVKNITQQSGATSFVYMMLSQLKKNYSVVAVEVDKHDFTYLPNKEKLLFSTTGTELGNFVGEHKDKQVILVDLNNANANTERVCEDILYLMEPSVIKLNKYMLLNPKGLMPFKGKKVVINQSLLSQKDILDFEYESGLKIFYNMPPLDDRESDIYILNLFLVQLGFSKQSNPEAETKKRTLFGFGK